MFDSQINSLNVVVSFNAYDNLLAIIDVLSRSTGWDSLQHRQTIVIQLISVFSLDIFKTHLYVFRYMPFMLMHFLDLALMIDGDEEQILHTLMDNRVPMSLCASPCCFFGICCKSSIVTR